MATLHPSVLAGTGALAGAYIATARALPARVAPRQALAFAGALFTILVALDGPIDALADARLFTAHMAQHLLLGYVLPPLLLLGLPDAMLRPLLRIRALAPVARVLTRPLVAFAAFSGFLVVLHLPPVYERMVRDPSLHVLLHLGLMATGVLGWWPLLSPLPELPRLTYPGQMLYLFLLLIPMAAVSAPIALASAVIYPWYAAGPHPFGVTPLTDQVVGGLLMWVGAGLYLMAVFSMIFFRWASRDDCDEPRAGRPATRRAA